MIAPDAGERAAERFAARVLAAAGPAVSVQLRYNHREENQPQTFAFANIGVRWTMNWISYLEEVPWTSFPEGYIQPEHIAVHVPQGGVERCAYPDAGGTYQRHYRNAAVLVKVSETPLRYERRHADGSVEVYALSDGGVPGTRRVFLTAVVDKPRRPLRRSEVVQGEVAESMCHATTLTPSRVGL